MIDVNERDDVMRQTLAHKLRVADLMSQCIAVLVTRAVHHDDSKFGDVEWPLFAEATPKLKRLTYGSDEYRASLKSIKPALDHHNAENSHHPEHYRWKCAICDLHLSQLEHDLSPHGPNDSGKRYCPRCCSKGIIYECDLVLSECGIDGMTLIDLLEMLCDWKAATERHADGNLVRSFEVNRERFKISPQLETVLINTARTLGFV